MIPNIEGMHKVKYTVTSYYYSLKVTAEGRMLQIKT